MRKILHSVRQLSGKPGMVPWLLALFCWGGMALGSFTAVWQQIELKLLDTLTVHSAPNQSAFPITIVGIDEASFAELGLQWPWPRRVHAKLVDQLAAAGAAVIVFDILFAEASNPEDDQFFADAIYRAGNVIMAADRVYRETSSVRQWLRIDPLPAFIDAGAQAGLATVTLGPDLVVRQIPESSEALWRTVAARLIQQHPEIGVNLDIKPGQYIRYVGGDHTFPYVSYHEVVNPTGTIPADFFKDQIVIVGRDVRAAMDVESAQADLFATPFLASTGWLMPGAEVHANILETVFGNRAIKRVPDGAVILLLGFTALLAGLAMRRWRPVWSLIFGMALAGTLSLAVWGAFVKWQLWIPAGASLAVIALIYLSLGGYSYLAEQARRKEINRTFALYVTPHVVDQLVAHPESIKLGGERREVTIMFTDLAGFTSFSESLSPEQVTHLLNRHFTEMTDIVLEYEGTVARFIGDAVMAFWGAPLDDADQAYHAVAAAIAMQKAMAGMRETFIEEGLPRVSMRIGIHSGSAVVGNLGSAKRFDYTAIGDDVNLAARLEGINKLYGTEIMVSGDTAKLLAGKIALRLIDKVIVKGKSQAVEVFSPCDDAELIELSGQAIHLFRNQEWDAAEACWRSVLALAPDDHLPRLYLERLARLRLAPPPEHWDGAVELEKM